MSSNTGISEPMEGFWGVLPLSGFHSAIQGMDSPLSGVIEPVNVVAGHGFLLALIISSTAWRFLSRSASVIVSHFMASGFLIAHWMA